MATVCHLAVVPTIAQPPRALGFRVPVPLSRAAGWFNECYDMLFKRLSSSRPPRRSAPPATPGRRQRGSTVVEMALIAPALMLLLIGLFEVSFLYYANLTMQYAVREAARYAVTGQSSADPNTKNQQRYLAIIQTLKNSSMGLYDSVSPVISVNQQTYANAASYNAGMFGGPGDIVVLQVDCTWTLATPLIAAFFTGGKYHFTVGATMQNEQY